MKVKISTNEKFHAITVLEPILAANMTAALRDLCEPFLKSGSEKPAPEFKRHSKNGFCCC